MLLGALVGAGVPVDVLQRAVDAIAPEPVKLRVEQVTRNGFAATRCHVEIADSVHHRTWRDIEALLQRRRPRRAGRATWRCASSSGSPAPRPAPTATTRSTSTSTRSARSTRSPTSSARAPASSTSAADARSSSRPVAVGSGHVARRARHAAGPAARGRRAAPRRPVVRRPAGRARPWSCARPTGAALLTTVATSWGPQPAMTIDRDRRSAPAAATPRGTPTCSGSSSATATPRADGTSLLLETNVDDLDPRVWPSVIAALLDAGASDAWLTPILMKKGRPAHTLSVLVAADRADGGARRRSSGTPRPSACASRRSPSTPSTATMDAVEVDGQPIAVKLAHHDGARGQRAARVRRRRPRGRRARAAGVRRTRRRDRRHPTRSLEDRR